jgi:hypothetical protein
LLAAALDRGQAFVFYSDGDMSQQEHSPEERKQVVLWMKARRSELKAWFALWFTPSPMRKSESRPRPWRRCSARIRCCWWPPHKARERALELLESDCDECRG